MKTTRRTAWTLSLLTIFSVGMAPFALDTTLCQPASAAAAQKISATGLDAKTLQLINKGQWNDAITRLKTLTDASAIPDNNQAWLAFGDMFMDHGDDLKALLEKINAMPGGKDSAVTKTVQMFEMIRAKNFDDAIKLGNELANNKDANQVVINMGLAAASAKSGRTAEAVKYCDNAIAFAPDFAWGYRTVGFIQEKTLKSPRAAEEYYVKALDVQPDFKEVRDLLSDLRVARNDFDGAIDVAQAAIKNNPRDASNYYRLSQVLTQQWRLREADGYLDKAIRLSPDNAKYHRAKASILRYQNNLTAAIAAQEKAVKLGNDKTFELTELAALNELAGNDSAAADNLRAAIQSAPVTQAGYSSAQQKLLQLLTRGKRYDDLIKEYQRAILAQPDQASLHLGLAEAYLKQDKVDEAMAELKLAADKDQYDPRPHRVLGSLLLQRKEFPGAARAYKRALDINPASVEDLVALGFSFAQNDEYMQAETAFVTALALQQLTNSQGNRSDVMRSLATLLLTEGRYTEAALNYEEILRAHKTAGTEHQDSFLLAETRALRDRTTSSVKDMVDSFNAMLPNEQSTYRVPFIDALLKLGKADTAIEQLAKADGQSEAQILTLQARAFRMKGDLAKAGEYIQKALDSKDESNESKADAYTEQANVLLAKGDANGADAAIRKATELDTKLVPAYEVLGRVYLKRNDVDHAIESAKHALDINPYYEPAYMLTGDAYVAANKLDQAANNYKRAVELYPAAVDAHRSLRDAYKKLSFKEEAQKEDEAISRLEKES
jgi:tetratricopeptide (TPR) repeat protein